MRSNPSSLGKVENSDLDTLTDLVREFYEESNYPFDPALARSALTELIGNPALGRIWTVVRTQDGSHAATTEVVGYLVVAFGFSVEFGGRDAFIDELYLRPAHRGCGLATKAMAEAEAECLRLDVRALHLEVESENDAAESLYRRRGFRERQTPLSLPRGRR